MKVNQSSAILVIFSLAAIFAGACGSIAAQKKTVIKGNIEGAGNLQVMLEKVNGDNSTLPIGKTECNANGEFTLENEPPLAEGIYIFKIGAKQFMTVIDQKDRNIQYTGKLADIDRFQYSVTGSETANTYVETLKKVINQQMPFDELKKTIETTPNAIVGMQLALQGIGPSAETMPILQAAYERVKKEKAGHELNQLYAGVMAQFEQQLAQQRAAEKIQVGQPAPEIVLNDPNGKTYKLSDLKGKVVLLDFWAAWCGPCRRANPKVVELYNKYKDKGFTVYSVSLDGVDESTRNRLASDEAQLKVQIDGQRQKWIDAIEKDQLGWPYHVSDLKKWDCAPAREYGVRGIPRTYLIDRNGNIAFINPRELENAILQSL
jgi:thiol-disulfide isomerase/thioredoxin